MSDAASEHEHFEGDTNRLMKASAWMALGTVFSRLTGFARSVLIIAALGVSLNADIFTGANTVPNSLYVIVAGGILNIILVPQLVRAMKQHDDGGEAFAQRIVTLGLGIMLIATIILILLVPLLMRATFATPLFSEELAVPRASAETLMRLCLPQVFFYGAFVLVGQILNARGRFGPMMWAPIANNVVACAMLVFYIGLYGASDAADGFTRSQELILGLGSTLGIAVQFAILVPILRKTGFHLRLRFDFRGVGLRKTAWISFWAFGFIVIDQIAFFVIQRAGTRATTQAATDDALAGGATVYQFAQLVGLAPHGIITVSIMTAAMPALAAFATDRHWVKVRSLMQDTLRLVLVAMAPIAVAMVFLAHPLAALVTSGGGGSDASHIVGNAIAAFAPAMLFATFYYLMLRGFYALEDTKTPFFMQLVVVIFNIALALWWSAIVSPANVATVLALANAIACAAGAILTTFVLSRRVGTVLEPEVIRFLVRLGVACLITAAALGGLVYVITSAMDDTTVRALVLLGAGGLLWAGVFGLMARLLHLREVSQIVNVVARRAR